jgi:hypothetical protein
MKKITNVWKEPLYIHLLKKVPGKRVPDRTVEQLLVGEDISVEEDRVSPELKRMRIKGRVTIEDINVEPKMEKPNIVEVEVVKEENEEPPSDDSSEDEMEILEQELLQSEHDSTEG